MLKHSLLLKVIQEMQIHTASQKFLLHVIGQMKKFNILGSYVYLLAAQRMQKYFKTQR